jgi:hypothetical protein
MEAPRLRETTLKLVSIDYAPYLEMAKLSPKAKETLLTLLVDKFTAIDGEEFKSYDALIEEALGSSEYLRFADYQRLIPFRKQADEGVVALQNFSLSPTQEGAVHEALLRLPVSTDASRSIMAKPQISEADVVAAEQSLVAEYRRAIQNLSVELSPDAQRALFEWYGKRVASQFRVMRMRIKMESHQ